jgi:hypothetical protein
MPPRRSRHRRSPLPTLHLRDLFKMAPTAFLERHWRPGVPVVARCSGGVLAAVTAFPALRNCRSLLAKRKKEVFLFGPKGFRAAIPPGAALPFLSQGYNLYIPGVQEDIPEAMELFAGVGSDLGMLPGQLGIEAFAGIAGGISSRHYDNDFNIQILLEGEKTWRMEHNDMLQNPLHSCHPQAGDERFSEEAHAGWRPLRLGFNRARTMRLSARAGTAMFVPRGIWHQALSRSSTWAISFQAKGVTQAQALAGALVDRLHRVPLFRAYLDSLPFEGTGTGAGEERRAAFARVKAAAAEALQDLTPEEAALSQTEAIFQWSKRGPRPSLRRVQGALCLVTRGASPQALQFDSEVIPGLAALLRFRAPFRWGDAVAAAGDFKVVLMHNLLKSLVDAGVMERGRLAEGGLRPFIPDD